MSNEEVIEPQPAAEDPIEPEEQLPAEAKVHPEMGVLTLKRSGTLTDIRFDVNPPCVIGRFDPAHGPIDIDLGSLSPEGSYVSRKHARIVHEDGVFRLEDMGSSNGTFVLRDGAFERIETAELADGLEIAFGNARFKFGFEVEVGNQAVEP